MEQKSVPEPSPMRNERIFQQKPGRPYSSLISPETLKPKNASVSRSRMKQSNGVLPLSFCHSCKRPKIGSNSVNIFSYCECDKVIQLPRKSVSKKKAQSISLITNNAPCFTFPTQKVSGFPLKPRNFSSLNKTIESKIMKKLNSTEFLPDPANAKEFASFNSKGRKKDESSKNKFLVYKGNNHVIVKKLLEMRPAWSEGYYSLPSSANFIWMPTSHNIRFERLKPSCSVQFVNHLEFHSEISNKSKLFTNIVNFCVSSKLSLTNLVPATFVIDFRDNRYFSQIHNFKVFMINVKSKGIPATHYIGKNIWIMKPAGLNRGRGINVFNDFDVLDAFVKDILNNKTPGAAQVYVIQKYIEQPLLIFHRKFDIRVWVLITQSENAYFFPQGYLRTSSERFSLDHLHNNFVHLTNNAIQKEGGEYGKYEAGNQMSFKDFQEYLFAHHGNIRLATIISQMKGQIVSSLLAVKGKLNPHSRLNCFEIFGYDFIIDANFKSWLIEVNTNPCLELSSPLLEQIIPRMLNDAFELTLDATFPTSKPELLTPNVLDLPKENLWEFLVSISNHQVLAINGVNI